jgi:hypothetical protein
MGLAARRASPLAGDAVRGQGSRLVAEVLTEPVVGPSVWRGDDLGVTDRWIIHLSEEDFTDFERALAHVSGKGLESLPEIGAKDFRLPRFRDRIDDVLGRLEQGPGLVLLRAADL